MLVYREKNNLIHKLHPITSLSYVVVIMLLSLIFSHPVYLLALFMALGAVITASGNLREWKTYLLIVTGMVVLIILVNSVFVQAGSNVLLTGPRVPVLGKVRITLEAICFSAVMGLRLLVIISAFCLYTHAVNPDKVLKLFSRFGKKSVLVVTLATRLFPLMIRDVSRITEVQRCRGVKLDTGSIWQRAKKRLPVINIVLLSSLERSLQLAESMHARGYGSGKMSTYSKDFWRPRDYIILLATGVAFVVSITAFLQGSSSFTYYPRLDEFHLDSLWAAPVIVLCLSVPAFLNWGWKKWQILKSKI